MNNNKKTRIVIIGGLLVTSIGLVVSGIAYLSTSIDNLQGWELPTMIASVGVGWLTMLFNEYDKSKDLCENRCGRKATVSITHLIFPPVFLGGRKEQIRLCNGCAGNKLSQLAKQEKTGDIQIQRLESGDAIIVTL